MKLYTENAHHNFYEGWGFMGNDRECDYYISIKPCGQVLISIVYSNATSDYSSPEFEMIKANPLHYWESPCKGYKELIKRLVAYGHLDRKIVLKTKFCEKTKKHYQLRVDGNVYVDLGCGWFESIFTTEEDFKDM